MEKTLVYDMKITSVAGGDPVEFTPARTHFTIMPRVIGVVGASPVPPTISVCSSFVDASTGGTCFSIARPVAGRTYSGSIMAIAPCAGLNSKVRIVALASATPSGGEDYGVRQVVADAFYAQSTSAVYQVRLLARCHRLERMGAAALISPGGGPVPSGGGTDPITTPRSTSPT